MKKEVLISITGLQTEIDKDEALEAVSPGEYYYRNGKHYVLYEELQPEENGIPGGITKNTLKFSGNKAELRKSGVNNVVMSFEAGKNTLTSYQTPVGSLMMGIDTKQMEVTEKEKEITIDIRYNLDINYSYVSECVIKIKIVER